MYVANVTCFLCLNHNKSVISTLKVDGDGLLLDDKLKYLLPEYVSFKPKISKSICTECVKHVEYIYKFKQKCVKNMKSLSEFFGEETQDEDKSLLCGTIKVEPLDIQGQITRNTVKNNKRVHIYNAKVLEKKPNIKVEKDPLSIEETSEIANQSATASKTGTEPKKIVKTFKCPDCPKVYNYRSHLEYHELTHQKASTSSTISEVLLDLKTYKCDICDAEFNIKANWVAHKLTHDDVKRPFACPICPKTYVFQIDLNSHRRRAHRVANFICKICGKAFNQNHLLLSHLRFHYNEKPFRYEDEQIEDNEEDIITGIV